MGPSSKLVYELTESNLSTGFSTGAKVCESGESESFELLRIWLTVHAVLMESFLQMHWSLLNWKYLPNVIGRDAIRFVDVCMVANGRKRPLGCKTSE